MSVTHTWLWDHLMLLDLLLTQKFYPVQTFSVRWQVSNSRSLVLTWDLFQTAPDTHMQPCQVIFFSCEKHKDPIKTDENKQRNDRIDKMKTQPLTMWTHRTRTRTVGHAFHADKFMPQTLSLILMNHVHCTLKQQLAWGWAQKNTTNPYHRRWRSRWQAQPIHRPGKCRYLLVPRGKMSCATFTAARVLSSCFEYWILWRLYTQLLDFYFRPTSTVTTVHPPVLQMLEICRI